MSSSRVPLPFGAGVALLIVAASCSPASAPTGAQNLPATPLGQPPPTQASVLPSAASPNPATSIAPAVQVTLTAQPAPNQAPVASSTATPNLQATVAAAVQATLTAQPAPIAPTVALQSPTSQPGQSAIQGKWEVTRGAVGSIYEFFDDGTISANQATGKYSWVQGNRLKTDFGPGTNSPIFTVKQSGDNMDLTNSAGQTTSLQRYQELDPTVQALAGKWQDGQLVGAQPFGSLAVQPNCLKIFYQQLNVVPPFTLGGPAIAWITEITFDASGTFAVVIQASSVGGQPGSPQVRGSYSVQGHGLGLRAASVGSHFSVSALLNCEITLSHTRLSFRDTPASDPVLFTRKTS